MTTIELLRECAEETQGAYVLAVHWIRRQQMRYGVAVTALALLERRAAQHPAATHFRVLEGGKIQFFTPKPKAITFFPGEIVDPRIEIRTVRRRGKTPRREFFVDGERHVKYSCAVAALRVSR